MSAWDAERWHAATGELDGLLGRTVEERAAALAALRARDPRLAADVEHLLRDHEAAGAAGFLEQGAAALLATTASTPGATPGRPGPRPRSAASLPAGAVFGGYRVRRVLGRGGMGVVYEAEEIESGRVVALKVLEQRLGDDRERERFEREGRLAASIDHEHCVFVFAAADVGGVPAIAMQLMQGTLADRLGSGGPLPAATAVDMALQLVEGLGAAARVGILHRDVKPSNCFVDGDGVVKIGDFGISRSLRPAEETALSTRNQFAATPTYASPEQLRGATLDARADIYSLGATLYELVTGRRPFTAPDLMSLLMAVANDAPAPPHTIVPGVPRGLSQVILRCLAKRPEDRYASYAALAAALEPYASSSPTPATLGRRFLAGLVDQWVLAVVTVPITLAVLMPRMGAGDWPTRLLTMAVSLGMVVLYYGTSEAIWARTPGKALFALRLADAAGRPPRPGLALARAALFGGAPMSLGLAMLLVWGPSVQAMAADSMRVSVFGAVGQFLILAAVFSTVRRRNGYAAVHDLVTGLRVVEARPGPEGEGRLATPAPAVAVGPVVGQRGPFAVLDGSIDGWPGWQPGFDQRLRRAVWIREVPIGTPPVAPTRSALARSTRLRWLAGRRTADEAWDVYEGVAGAPLAAACHQTRRSWSEVRRWLGDLAHEIAAQRPGDQPPLTLDRVWILDSGRAKLLDDPTIDAPRADGPTLAIGLLIAVARCARTRGGEPWPLSASRFVESLTAAPSPALPEVARAADGLTRGRAAITRGWRGLSIAGVLLMPGLLAAMMIGAGAFVFAQMRSAPLDTRVATHVLRDLERVDRGYLEMAPDDRDALEVVLAGRYRTTLSDARLYAPERMLALTPAHKTVADRILQRKVAPGSVDAAAARPAVRARLELGARFEEPPFSVLALMLFYGTLIVVAVLGLVGAIAVRGVMLRLLGFEIVTADGRRASRLRVLGRSAIAWSPVLAPLLASTVLGGIGSGAAGVNVLFSATLVVQLAGAVVAIVQPSRGLQDRLAGTWIVPR